MKNAEAVVEEINERIDNAQQQDGDEYLTFRLANEEYGFDILRVQEIRGWEKVTRIPNSLNYVKGVLNLRGAIVPIMDLRIRFDLPQAEYTPTTVVVVLSVMSVNGTKERIVGVVVDAISDVVNAKTSDIQSTPNFDASIEIEYIQGLATAGDKMLMLVDVDKLLNIEEDVSLLDSEDHEDDD
ncbi:MAG: chemotaxis protein CheW [Gammaproteobacteria bacterium]|nr:chemotaxis protein CheW [Gammaproteobacteria bacterium]MCW8910260.1 chemotaxis protein CheW [Gammaproteobacteria bacterium]MCW9005296.1 chemotaxis protein CheW [Gammaproteobacteria bacterium]MCW9056741.1 chemotaxis protein CheW [Gammaproteobacteria bacterium]